MFGCNKYGRSSGLVVTVLSCMMLLISSVVSQEQDDVDPLAVLGEPVWTRLRPGWSLTVNDQCLYEFIFQFEHDKTLPVGEEEFTGVCTFGDDPLGSEPGDVPGIAPDGKLFLQTRQMWERFPDYVWATTGFNHLSIDWKPCGRMPRGYTTAQYGFSFFRVTPEFRAHTMKCKLLPDGAIPIPGDQICDQNQDDPSGMGFYIVPSPVSDRSQVVNMPIEFSHPEFTNAGIPHYGLTVWDPVNVPEFPADWTGLPIVMSTYSGDLVMWQANFPYKMMSGEVDQFHSDAARYVETTVQTLPDTWAVDYSEKDGLTRFIMVGKAGLCREDFEVAQKAAGGAPIFPNYDDLFAQIGVGQDGNEKDGDDDDDDDDDKDKDDKNNDSGTPLGFIHVTRTQRLTLLIATSLSILFCLV